MRHVFCIGELLTDFVCHDISSSSIQQMDTIGAGVAFVGECYINFQKKSRALQL